MRRPVTITAPFATPEETARSYGISKRRADELRKMVEESLAKKGYVFFKTNGKDPASKNGASEEATRTHRLRTRVRVKTRAKSKAAGNVSRRKTTRAKAKPSR
jgi:hypothetical protein